MGSATYQQRGNQSRNSSGNGHQNGELITGQQQLNEAKAKLDRMKGEIEKIAGNLVSPDELVRFTLNACVKNPKLFECFQTAEGTASVFLSIITSRIIEIPCDGIHGYLVPFYDSQKSAMICQFMPGYKGYAQLAYSNPNIASVNCAAVYENDAFDFEYGTDAYLRHKPTNDNRGKLAWAYAIFKTKDGYCEFRVLTKEDVEKRKNVSKSKDRGPWRDWEAEMWAKTAFLTLAKVAPLGAKVSRAAAVDDRIQTHGNLTTDQLQAIKAEKPAALGYEPTESAFEPTGEPQSQREPEPARRQQRQESRQEQREEPPEQVTAMSLLDRIENAVNANALKTIMADANKALQQQQIEQHEHDQIASMAQEAKVRLGK